RDRAHPRPAHARPRRAVRGRRPRLRREHPRHPRGLRRERGDRRRVVARHGPRPAHVRPRRRRRGRTRPGRGDRRRGPRRPKPRGPVRRARRRPPEHGGPRVVAQFVRLKLTLMGNTFRRSVWQTIGFLVGALYGLFVVGMLVVGMVVLGTDDPALAGSIMILVGALAVLGWWVIPLFAFKMDATLDPQRGI